MPCLRQYDAAVALVCDRRYATEWPRLKRLFGGRVRSLTAFVDGDGRVLHPDTYDQLHLSLPPGWAHGRGAYQHFRAVQEIIRWARNDDLESVLLVEDDCVLTGDADAIIDAADGHVRGSRLAWDVLYYGANHSDATTEEVGPNLLRVDGSLTTHMVGFHRRVYDAVLALEPTHVIDNLIARHIHPRFNCYSLWPAAAVQKPGYSLLWNQRVDYTDLFRSRGRPPASGCSWAGSGATNSPTS